MTLAANLDHGLNVISCFLQFSDWNVVGRLRVIAYCWRYSIAALGKESANGSP
jgi:hypothetical protein